MSNFLNRYRTKLKLSATQQLEETINKVYDLIADDSPSKNVIILVQARYQNLEGDSIKGIVAEPDRVLRTNQIMNSLFELIDNLKATDLQESDDVLLNDYLKKEQIKKDSEIPTINPLDDVTKAIDSSEEITKNVSLKLAEHKEESADSKSAKDLEIFSEMNRVPLNFFPVVYRDIRTIVIRNGKASLEIGKLIGTLEKHIPTMNAFKDKVDQLEPILKKIRVEQDKKVYWLQFQKLSNQRTILRTDDLGAVIKMNEDLDAFLKMLKDKKVVGEL